MMPKQIKVRIGCVFYKDYGDDGMIEGLGLTEDK